MSTKIAARQQRANAVAGPGNASSHARVNREEDQDEAFCIFALSRENVQNDAVVNRKRLRRIETVVFLAVFAFAAVYLIGHVAAASLGLHPVFAFLAAIAAGLYVGVSLMREVPR